MKILILSDSHGNHDLVRKAIGQEAPIDMLIHAGDVEGDLDKILGKKRDYEIRAVAGNMDWSDKPTVTASVFTGEPTGSQREPDRWEPTSLSTDTLMLRITVRKMMCW